MIGVDDIVFEDCTIDIKIVVQMDPRVSSGREWQVEARPSFCRGTVEGRIR